MGQDLRAVRDDHVRSCRAGLVFSLLELLLRLGRPVTECKCYINGIGPTMGVNGAECHNTGCTSNDPEAPGCCETWEEVEMCPQFVSAGWGVIQEDHQEAADAGSQAEAAEAGVEEGEQTAGDDAGAGAAEPVGEEAPEQVPFIERAPDRISKVFTRPLPVPVSEEKMDDHAKELARLQLLHWETGIDKKAFAKSCKDIMDECEEQGVALSQIVKTGTEERQVPCRTEFDYTEGVKRIRRMDNWMIVETAMLRGDELQIPLDLEPSEQAVEQLCEHQAPSKPQKVADEQPVDEMLAVCKSCKATHPNCSECCANCLRGQECLNAQFCTLPGAMDHGSICAVCVGLCGDYTPGTSVSDCPGFRTEITEDESARRDTTCPENWHDCQHAVHCFSPVNEGDGEHDGDCVCLKEAEQKEQEKIQAKCTHPMTQRTKHEDGSVTCDVCGFELKARPMEPELF